MTLDEASSVLQRMESGEHFEDATVREAERVRSAWKARIARVQRAAPPGCVWERPAPGWIDLRRWRQ
jgi:hypothetical protein